MLTRCKINIILRGTAQTSAGPGRVTTNVVQPRQDPREAAILRGARCWQSGCCRAVIGSCTALQPISVDHLSGRTRQPVLAWDSSCKVVGCYSCFVEISC